MKFLDIIIYSIYASISILCSPAILAWLMLERLRPRAFRRPASGKSLRVAYLSTDIWVGRTLGGPTSHKLGFCQGLMASGHLPIVLVSQPVPPLEGLVKDYHLLPAPRLPRGLPLTICVLANNVLFTWRAYRILNKLKPDVVCHRHSKLNYAGLVLARALGVPFVLEYNSPASWKLNSQEALPFLDRCVSRHFEYLNLTAADRILVVSDVLRQRLVACGVQPETGTGPGDSAESWSAPSAAGMASTGAGRRWLATPRSKPKRAGGKIVVGWAGTYGQYHGVEYLAKAARMILELRKDVRFLFVGYQKLVDIVSAIAEAEGIRSAMTFLTNVPHSEMPSYYAACDILASPHIQMADGSTFFGSPTKIFEYMAMGRPIVASGVGQLAELLKDRENALLTRPGDVQDIANAILTLVGEPELRERLGRAARETCLSRCTWKHNADRFISAYRSVVEPVEC